MDSRIRTLVENCVKTGQRSLFVVVGDKGRDQVCVQWGCGWVLRRFRVCTGGRAVVHAFARPRALVMPVPQTP